MCVGISPGQEEMKSGKPDTGRAGQLMEAIFEATSIPSSHVYHTNLWCYTVDPTITPVDVDCGERLLQEIEAIHPRIVICFGLSPAEFLITKKPHRGYLYQKEGCIYTYTYHPASVLRENGFVYDIVRDLSKIPYLLEHPTLTPTPNVPQHVVIQSREEAQYVLDHLEGTQALDIETRMHDPNTDDLDIYSDDLICLAISNATHCYVFPRDVLDNLVWPTKPTITWIFHNGMFDVQGLYKYLGIRLPIDQDTMLYSYASDEYAGSATHPRKGQNKLETLTGEYFGDLTYKEVTKKSWRKHIQPQASDLFLRNAKDAYYTHALYTTLPVIRPACPAYESLLLPAANMFSRIVEYGVYIDPETRHALMEEWGPTAITLLLQVKEHVDNPRSWQQLSHYLYDPEDMGGLGLSAEGAPSTAKHVLQTIDHPFVHSVLDLKQYIFLLNNWVIGINKHIKKDGLLHPNVLLHGTEGGRRSYHEPALQTIPKHGDKLEKIRSLFSARPGYTLVEADYAQIEMWIAAYVSEDATLLQDLQGGDVHAATARRLGGVDRQIGKTLNFLMLYGGGALKAQATLAARGVDYPIQMCEELVQTWRTTYQPFAQWTNKIWTQICDEGYIETVFGRYRRCPLVTDSSWRATFINFPIQSTAGDYILDSFLNLEPLLAQYDSHILFDVHDSGIYEIPTPKLSQVIPIIQQVMESPKRGLPGVKVEVTYGPSLGEQKKWKVL